MNIKETFLKLTEKTYPYGNEYRLRHLLPEGTQKDKHGNYYLKIGKSKTIFASHLDTACKKHAKVTHVIDGDIIKTNGKTILGADDKAGVTVLLYMIEQNVPGLYYFFIGEEVGCIGSKASSAKDDFSKYDRIISFDRRDTCSIITHQGWERCCSDDFAEALTKAYNDLDLGLKPDDTGVHTDSAEFTGVISECTNISVGYYKEHTHDEHQNIAFLEKLCMASAIIDWESLPTKRNFKVKEYKRYNYQQNAYPQQGGYRNRRAREWNRSPYDEEWEPQERRERQRSLPPANPLAYGYSNFDIEDIPEDRGMILDLRNRNKKGNIVPKQKMGPRELTEMINRSNKDLFLTFKDYLDPKFTMEEHSIIQEQFLNFN